MINSFLKLIRKSSFLRQTVKAFYYKYPRLSAKIRSIMLANFRRDIPIDQATPQEIDELRRFLQKLTQNKSAQIVLQLSTYPFRQARHGGQLRCQAIAARYKAEGYICIPFIIREEENYIEQKNSIDEVIFPVSSAYRNYKNKRVAFITDYLSGIFATEESKVIEAIQRRIAHEIHFIHVEQPWLFRFSQKLKAEWPAAHNAKVIYGSQNIEHKLKNEILKMYQIEENICDEVTADIMQLELYAAQHADWVLAVSEQDKNFLEGMAKRKVILCPNATFKKSLNKDKVKFWQEKLPKKFYIFIASAHPPNIVGFFSMVADCENFLPEGSKIVVVGSVTRLFEDYKSYLKNKVFDMNRLINIGIVDDDDLAALLFCAHAVLVPITVGGGTNLKTAEALLSGKYVVSTKIGFRGYDHYADAPGVYISERPEEFQKNMRLVWSMPPPDFEKLRGNNLTWDRALDPLFEEIA